MPNLDYTIIPPSDDRSLRGLQEIGRDLGAASDSTLEVRLFDNAPTFNVEQHRGDAEALECIAHAERDAAHLLDLAAQLPTIEPPPAPE